MDQIMPTDKIPSFVTEKNLIVNIRQLLTTHKISESELARKTHIPKPTLHKILTGKTEDPRISTLQSIAHFFDLTIDELYTASIFKTKNHIFEAKFIPIISWKNCIQYEIFIEKLTPSNWTDWIVIENNKKGLYGLASKTALESQFPKEATLIIDPNDSPSDGDFVVVKYPDIEEATLRKISIDGPAKLLLPINNYAECEKLNPEIQLLGVVIQSRLNLK